VQKVAVDDSEAIISATVYEEDNGTDPTDAFWSSLTVPVKALKLRVEEFSGLLPQEQRTSLMTSFKKGKIDVVVCSDVMSRGIDVSDVDVVINYDVPLFIQSYIHRSGRTARAGKSGSSYTLVKKSQMHHFKEMLKKSVDCWSQIRRHFQDPYSFNDLSSHYKALLQALEVNTEKEKNRI